MPVFKVTDPQTGRTVKLTGDSPPTEAELEEIFADVTPQGALGASIIEPLGTVVTGAIAEPVAGLAGIAGALLPGEEGQGERFVEATREALTFKPKTVAGQEGLQALGETLQPLTEKLQAAETIAGDVGFELTGEPAVAAAFATLPTIAMEVLGIAAAKGITKAVSKIPGKKATDLELEAEQLELDAEQLAQGRPTDAGMEESAAIIARQDPEEIGELVQADPEFYKAADELGISTEPLASFASRNPQFRAVEQGLASVPASQLDTQAKAFISDVTSKADEVIEDFGGTLDKAELSTRFRDESKTTIDNIYDNETTVYQAIEKALPRETRVPPTETVAYLQGLARQLGGTEFLPAKFKTLLNDIRPRAKTIDQRFDFATGSQAPIVENINPTYGLLNARRSEVGQQLGRKGNTQFKDIESGQLKGLYGAMKRDQNKIATEFSTPENGLSQLTEMADGMTKSRKQIEDNLVSLIGKDLNKDLMTVVGTRVKGLAKGDVKQFRNTIEQIPKNLRSQAVLSAMNDVFKGSGVGQQSLSPTQFTKFMNSLDRSPTTKKALFDNLPPDSIKAIENLATLNRGISRALPDKITTGRIAAFFEENNTLMKRLMGRGAGLVATKIAGPAGAFGAHAVEEFLSNISDQGKAANALMASNKFQQIVRDSVKEGIIEGNQASRKLENSAKAFEKAKKFRDWQELLSDGEKLKLANVGLVGYLFGSDEQDQQ